MGLEERIIKIVAYHEGIEPEKISLDMALVDVGLDSLDSVELIMQFEEEFGIEIPDEDAEKMITVGAIVKYIQDKTGD